MTTYTIPEGTPIWRTQKPERQATVGLGILGALGKDGWRPLGATTCAVTYTDADLYTPLAPMNGYYYFRLPAGAAPWTMIEVLHEYVKVTK